MLFEQGWNSMTYKLTCMTVYIKLVFSLTVQCVLEVNEKRAVNISCIWYVKVKKESLYLIPAGNIQKFND